MNQILSQDEVDALLKGLDTGEVEADKEQFESEDELESYDWSNQVRNLKGDIPIFGIINSKFAKNVQSSLSGTLRKKVEIDPGPIEMIKFQEFQRSLPVPTSLHLFKMEPLRGMGMLVIETRLVFSLIETFFGGSGVGSTKIEGRDFTPIERRIIDKVVSMAMKDIEEAWQENLSIKTEFIRSESNPLGANVYPPSEVLISVKFEVELKKTAGNIIFCIPFSSIEPIRDKLSGGYMEEEKDQDEAWVRNLNNKLNNVEVEFSVDLGNTQLPVKDFLNMKKGDILILDNMFQNRLLARIEGIPKFEGYAGRSKNVKVFKVENELTPQSAV